MNDGRILAKISEHGSLATHQASLVLAIEMSIVNFSPIANDQEFPALILAAGATSRMGRSKALLPLAGQQGILFDRAIDLGRALSWDVRVVCGTLAKQTCQPGNPDAENAQAGGETDRINPGRRGTLL